MTKFTQSQIFNFTLAFFILSFIFTSHSLYEYKKFTERKRKLETLPIDVKFQTESFKHAKIHGHDLSVNNNDIYNSIYKITVINITPKYWVGVYEGSKLFMINVKKFFDELQESKRTDVINEFRKIGLILSNLEWRPVIIKNCPDSKIEIDGVAFEDKDRQYYRVFSKLIRSA